MCIYQTPHKMSLAQQAEATAEGQDATAVEIKMFPAGPSRRRTALAALALVLYVYLLCLLKALYDRAQRVERILNMAAQSENMIRSIQLLEHNVAFQLKQLQELEPEI